MTDHLKKLYLIDPLFRALVHARLNSSNSEVPEDTLPEGALSAEEELIILREYAITLFKEHKTLKNLFMESLKVSGKSVGLNDPSRPSSKA